MCQPTAAELEADALEDRARAQLRKDWERTRGGLLYDRATDTYDNGHWIITLLERDLEAYILDNLDAAMLSISEADEEAKDPYAARGLHRSMFL